MSIGRHGKGFTLIELLVVIAIIGVLASLVVPVARKGVAKARSAACMNNLKQMYAAYRMYLDDHEGRFFRWRETAEGGTLWYWGYESGSGGAEGTRPIDKSRAKLAPYLGSVGGVEICPALAYDASYFKRKFEVASYGYGINVCMLSDMPQAKKSGVRSFDRIQQPSETVCWGDCAQVNTFQAPASPKNPMIEEWFYLSMETPANFHFRHDGKMNAVMADGSVRSFEPAWLDGKADGLTGQIEPRGEDRYLRLVKSR